MTIKIMAAMVVLVLAGGCGSLDRQYVQADRLTRTAVAPKLARYAAEHPDDAPAVNDLLSSWEKRLAAAEK